MLARTGSKEADLACLGEEIWRNSEGNPFVVVETMRALDQGVLSRASTTLSLPERVRELIAQRLDRIGERGQHLVGIAAVIGQEFEFALVQRVAEDDAGQAAAGIEELVRRRLVAAVGDCFAFTHDRIREEAYRRLLSPRRKLLHRQVAEAMRSLYSAELERRHLALGVHYRAGEVWDQALTHFRHAGRDAVARAAGREALASFDAALQVLEHLPKSRTTIEQAIDVRLDLQAALNLQQVDTARKLDSLQAAQVLAEGLGDRGRLGHISAQMAHYYYLIGRSDQGIRAGERALGIASALGDASLEILSRYHLGQACLLLGRYDQAIALFQRIIEVLGDDRPRNHPGLSMLPAVSARALLSKCFAALGAFTPARAIAEEGARLADAADHTFSQVAAYQALGAMHLTQGNMPEAVAWLERTLALIQQLDAAVMFHVVTTQLGRCYALAGRVAEAIALQEGGLTQRAYSGAVPRHPRELVYLAESYLLADRSNDAASIAEPALDLCRSCHQRWLEPDALRILGQIHASHEPPERERAEHAYRQAFALADELGMRPTVAHCHFGLGTLYFRTGDRAQGEHHFAEARTMFREMDMGFWLERTEVEMANSCTERPRELRAALRQIDGA
jgi:tetratricopeptide (TPR) repeat protein